MCLSVCTLTLGEPFKVILYRLEALLLEFLDVSKRKVTLDLTHINVWHPGTQTCVPQERISPSLWGVHYPLSEGVGGHTESTCLKLGNGEKVCNAFLINPQVKYT